MRRATAIGYVHKNLVNIGCAFWIYAREQTDTYTDRHAHHNTPLFYPGGSKNLSLLSVYSDRLFSSSGSIIRQFRSLAKRY